MIIYLAGEGISIEQYKEEIQEIHKTQKCDNYGILITYASMHQVMYTKLSEGDEKRYKRWRTLCEDSDINVIQENLKDSTFSHLIE